MDSFDNFQYDSASTYGGLPVVDDTSSIVSGYTENRLPVNLESLSNLSISGDSNEGNGVGKGNGDKQAIVRANAVDEELDGVLDDLKDESAVDLPPHACRCVLQFIRRLVFSI